MAPDSMRNLGFHDGEEEDEAKARAAALRAKSGSNDAAQK